MEEITKSIRQQLYEGSVLRNLMADILLDQIVKAVYMITDCIKSGGKIILFGNGGSAADAQHLAAEFVGRFKLERKAIPAMALSTNTSSITAIANDYNYDLVFARQIEAFANEKDVIIGISTSGNSQNVIEGIIKAKDIGAKTIGLTGGNGGKIGGITDIPLIVPSSDTPRIQEAHIAIGHILCDIVENNLVDKLCGI